MNRGFWFLAGAGVGVYGVVKVRRAAEALTPGGLRDRLAGLSLGAQLLNEEVRTGMAVKETELRERLGVRLDGTRELTARHPEPANPSADHLTNHPATGKGND